MMNNRDKTMKNDETEEKKQIEKWWRREKKQWKMMKNIETILKKWWKKWQKTMKKTRNTDET